MDTTRTVHDPYTGHVIRGAYRGLTGQVLRLGHDRRWMVANLIFAGGYILAGKLGLALASVHPSATPVWPPTGIALAAMLICGYRVWPGVLAAAFLVNYTTAGTVVTASAIAVGNTLEALLGAYLVNRVAN